MKALINYDYKDIEMAQDINDVNILLAKTTQRVDDHIMSCGEERTRSDKAMQDVWIRMNDRDIRYTQKFAEINTHIDLSKTEVTKDINKLRSSVQGGFKWLVGIILSALVSGLILLLSTIFDWVKI